MSIWSSEIKDLEKVFLLLRGALPELEKELERLIVADDENMLLVYSRRCLEVIVTHLCEKELNRQRGTEPLQRIIDKLKKENIVPHNIIVAMLSVNSMSTFGAHPKEFELKQIKPVLINLTTIIEWYITYKKIENDVPDPNKLTLKPSGVSFQKSRGKKRPIHIKWATGGLFVVVGIALVLLNTFNVLKLDFVFKKKTIESVVIKSFQNLTGDESMDILLAGMHSMFIDNAQQLEKLRIPSYGTSVAYNDRKLTLKELSTEAETDAVIEPIVTCFGDTICIMLKLHNTIRKERVIWEKEYKMAKSELNKLNNQTTKDFAKELGIELSQREEKLLSEWKDVEDEAWDYYLEGRGYLVQISRESLPKAKEYFEKAIGVEPEWTAPYAGLASVGSYQNQMSHIPREDALKLIRPNLEMALKLDPNSAISHAINAGIAVWTDWDWKKGEKEFEKALELNPNDALCRMFYAHFLMIMKRHDDAQEQAELALKNDPETPFIMGLYGVVMRVYSKYDLAITQLEKAHNIDSTNPFVISSLMAAYRWTKNYEKWFELWKKQPGLDDETILKFENILRNKGYHAVVEELIKQLEEILTEGGRVPFMNLGNLYNQLGRYEKAIDYWEKAYEEHNPNAPYLSMYTVKNKALNDQPRYIELIKKMNLPLE